MEPDDIEEALTGAEELAKVLDDLEARSRSFGTALTSALKGAVLDSDSLVEVLQNIAYRFSSISLDVGLKPLYLRGDDAQRFVFKRLAVVRHAEICAEVEQFVLDARENGIEV